MCEKNYVQMMASPNISQRSPQQASDHGELSPLPRIKVGYFGHRDSLTETVRRSDR